MASDEVCAKGTHTKQRQSEMFTVQPDLQMVRSAIAEGIVLFSLIINHNHHSFMCIDVVTDVYSF